MKVASGSRTHQVGDLVIDGAAFRVLKGGRPLDLEPKAIDVLLYLVDRQDQLISKEELIADVWKGVAVTDNALTRIISKLRRALDDDAHDCRYIETVPTRGYRFVGHHAPLPSRRRQSTAIAVVAIATVTLVVTAIATAIHRDSPLTRSPGYQAYIQGVYFQGNRWMAGGCRNAEGYLFDSIARDPDFAPAYAALAWCYAYPDRADRPIDEITQKAKEWVTRALVLDSRLALAHAVLGTIKWRVEYDPVGAEPEFKTALALDPRSGLVRLPYAELLLWHRHQRDAGLDLLRPVIDLDPFSPDRHVQVGFILMSVGLYDEAVARFRKALELDPEYGVATLWLAETYAYKNERDRAIREYLRWIDVSLRRDRSVSTRALLERTFSSAGWDAFWREELSMVLEEKAHRGSFWAPTYVRYTGSYYMARRFARLRDWERALDALEAAYQERHHLMAMVPVDPLFVPLQGSPRFRALLRRMGAPL